MRLGAGVMQVGGAAGVLEGPPQPISLASFTEHLLSAEKMSPKAVTLQGLCLLRDASVLKQNKTIYSKQE